MKVLIAGGGTAGHVFPAVALAQELSDRGVACTFVGASGGLESTLVPEAGFPLIGLDVIGFPRRPSRDLIRAPLALWRAYRRCRDLVTGHAAVVGVGGYASAPAVLAAQRARIPVVLHEQNAVPGLANRLLSRRASAVALSFPEAGPRFPRRVPLVLTGNPVRRQVADMDAAALRAEAMARFGFDPHRRTLVVFGGSQGALHLDQAILDALGRWRERSDLQVLLLTGAAHETRIAAEVPEGALRVCVRGFLDRMELAYAVADLVVSRAGATSIAETTACGIPALLIPYPHATGDHQRANAASVVASGAAEMMLDAELDAGTLAVRVDALLADPERLARMGAAARGRGSRGAAAALADLVVASA